MLPPDDHIAAIRTDYRLAALDEAAAGEDPLAFFGRWFAEAEAAQLTEVNAMTLATVDEQQRPHARIVLLKGLDDRGFVFYTNYDSDKGREIAGNHHTALVFFWKELERQVRIEGRIERVTEAESDAYFNSRPAGSRIGALASPQSREIESRDELEAAVARLKETFTDTDNIPRPAFWGGYRVLPERIEFWQGRSSRLHDRLVFSRQADGNWERFRIAP